jgi:hypothetical protein
MLTPADKLAIRILSKTKSDSQIAKFLGVTLYTVENFKKHEK